LCMLMAAASFPAAAAAVFGIDRRTLSVVFFNSVYLNLSFCCHLDLAILQTKLIFCKNKVKIAKNLIKVLGDDT